MHICIFEDKYYKNFLPLIYFRPVYHLHCGALSLREKIECVLPRVKTIFHMRNEIAENISEHFPKLTINKFPNDDIWFINGRVLGDKMLAKLIKSHSKEQRVYIQGDSIAAAFVKKENLSSLLNKLSDNLIEESIFKNMPTDLFPGIILNYPWDLVNHIAEEIEKDFQRLRLKKNILGKVYIGAHLRNKKKIIIGKGSKIKSGAVLDAEKGPIIIGSNVTIMPNAVIEGPAFVGDNSTIKIGAKIYHGTSIGKWCKVGGEVEASIIQSYTNKQHEGFLGHSYLGSWINIGADTNTSDLKNNYSTVKVHVNGKMIDSGQQFVGLMMGDHSKSGINTMFDTGTVVGISCNIYGSGYLPKFIPSFTRGGEKKLITYDVEKSIDIMKIVMARRDVKMTASYEKLVRKVFKDTIDERQSAGVK
ncbi:MAG: GlmU family protein [Bacteroidota bacterium]|nr:GlmU family protein [Bacteroidota bacterium]